ncbi:hypothetical protein MTR67_043966 [Solanum verrucosum]|uniref:Reverse transcriptase n=1 Tax=Solanum verrucosum TaxID=315347 RepID=A0AAF0ZT56_SOLVR|nr:hypothetical protein MTR67_043966 [Solanum verrucosum]
MEFVESRTYVDFIILDMVDFDVSMTWLSPNFAILDCNAKIVTSAKPGIGQLVWEGDYIPTQFGLHHFFVLRVPSTESLSIVREFVDVFPVDLPNMTQERNIDFCIDMEPVTRSISIPPCRMVPDEFSELKAQLQKLLRKYFIRAGAFPWGAPISL